MTANAPTSCRILVATDFSPCADAALHQAAWLAKHARGEIVLAHVVADLRKAVSRTSYRSRIEFLEGQEEQFQRELRRESDEKLTQAIRDLGSTGVKITYETLLGQPYVELIHAVQQEGYDIVVAGTRGRGSWQQLFLGSTARSLIRKCPVPVWIVKRVPARAPTSILVAVDMSDISRLALQQALVLAKFMDSKLHVAHVIEHDLPEQLLDAKSANSGDDTVREWARQQAREKLDELLKPVEIEATPIVRHLLWGAPGEQIVTRAKEIGADLIVLGTVGRTGLQGLLLGNTAENVLVHSECDILAVKPAGFQSSISPASWALHPGPEQAR